MPRDSQIKYRALCVEKYKFLNYLSIKQQYLTACRPFRSSP